MGAKGRIIAGAGAALLLVNGCGAGRTLGKVAVEEAANIPRLTATRWVPKALPTQQLRLVPVSTVRNRVAGLIARVDDLEFEETVDVVRQSCEMADLIKAGGPGTDLRAYLLDQGRSEWDYSQRAQDLAHELAGQGPVDFAQTLAAAAVCEASQHHGSG